MRTRTYHRAPDAVVTNTPGLMLLAFLAIAAPGAVAAACWRLRPRSWELRAEYRGLDAILYISPDARVFNQVDRALQRAGEDTTPHRRWQEAA